jgi:hypothetical protein
MVLNHIKTTVWVLDMIKKGDKIFGLYSTISYNHVEGKGMGLFMVKLRIGTTWRPN